MPPVPHTPAAEAPDHAALIVALDADDIAGADRVRAEALAASCAGCSSLLADLALIRAALPVLAAPPRRRDYRLTEEDAARLRPAGLRHRVLDWLAAPRSSVRPLATGLATLGVVGLLVAAGLPGLGGVGSSGTMLTTSAPAEEAVPAGGGAPPELGATAVPLPAATAAPSVQAPGFAAPTSPPPDGAAAVGEASPGPFGERSSATGAADMATEATKAAPAPEPAGGISPLAAVSGGLLAAGALLLLARALALRRAA
jgi:hypothetical protein